MMTATKLSKLGFAMDGLEDSIATYVERVCEKFGSVTYVEIGVGHGKTLTSIAQYLREALGADWRAIGVELPNGYSFNRIITRDNAAQKHLAINFDYPAMKLADPAWNVITVYLKDSHSFLGNYWKDEIHLALIDGCHGKKCAMLDFLLLEPFIPEGGFVMMHDFGKDQIGQKQPHCADGIDVRGAANELGLLINDRPNWEFTDELIGDAGAGNMGVFQKTGGN